MNHNELIANLISAIRALTAAVEALNGDSEAETPNADVLQDANEHFDELEVLMRLIAKLL
ncbi:hypothetical protein [Microbacterium sp. T32]|uniref:hypothetical protein n=1 Tax=Microbacterium sp. T32 TaxID=1776083 RepID=UPI0007AB486A|nr:hypothetical protein [Microbacterium sp. T32]KZE42039.1 hypothetical protein AVW09_10970 [Microbacterium sp. T32]